MTKSQHKAVGVDIGGTGVKAALVDVAAGTLLSDRVKVPTPAGGEPDAIRDAVVELVSRLDVDDDTP
ncbi:MAG TPA: ROK family protein, partial [Agrococcus sp.]|nr:ROK family protein [Agrococcus sp.]